MFCMCLNGETFGVFGTKCHKIYEQENHLLSKNVPFKVHHSEQANATR